MDGKLEAGDAGLAGSLVCAGAFCLTASEAALLTVSSHPACAVTVKNKTDAIATMIFFMILLSKICLILLQNLTFLMNVIGNVKHDHCGTAMHAVHSCRTLPAVADSSTAIAKPADQGRTNSGSVRRDPDGTDGTNRRREQSRIHPHLRQKKGHGIIHDPLILLVGATGFEPVTSCSQSRRATRLRYAPSRFFRVAETAPSGHPGAFPWPGPGG